jgi:hypothetical protein
VVVVWLVALKGVSPGLIKLVPTQDRNIKLTDRYPDRVVRPRISDPKPARDAASQGFRRGRPKLANGVLCLFVQDVSQPALKVFTRSMTVSSECTRDAGEARATFLPTPPLLQCYEALLDCQAVAAG